VIPQQPTAPAGLRRVRAGDDDRARAASLLADHYAHGRLDDSELDERTSRALTAVYTDELNDLFGDLPGARVGAPVERSSRTTVVRPPRVPRRRSGVPLLLVAAVLLVVLTRGAALWLLLPLWWFAGPALLDRRRTSWDGAGHRGPPGSWSGCRAVAPVRGRQAEASDARPTPPLASVAEAG
jgi:hypothetical protein